MDFHGTLEINEQNLLNDNFLARLDDLVMEYINPKSSAAAKTIRPIIEIILKSHGLFWIYKNENLKCSTDEATKQ
jgi:hypothetical protein